MTEDSQGERRDTGAPDPVGVDGRGDRDEHAEVIDLRARVEELQDRWRRSAADLENVRKRAAREVAEAGADERARVAARWLPVLDNLDLALEHAASDPATIVAGIESVRAQALTVLERLGYHRIDDTGRPFDPARHEAVSTATGTTAPDGTVLQVVRPGYGDDRKLLRPASVVVATGHR